jgi:hypothetical protein
MMEIDFLREFQDDLHNRAKLNAEDHSRDLAASAIDWQTGGTGWAELV